MEISKEAISRYLTRRKENVITLEQSLSEKNVDAFKMIGHQLKGNARTFGFDDLEVIGVELEKISESHDWVRAQQVLMEFKKWIDAH